MKKTMFGLSVLLMLCLLLALPLTGTAEDTAAAQNAPEGACTRDQFVKWYDEAKARLEEEKPEHLLGPEGDINRAGKTRIEVYTVILPGEKVGVLPEYSLDKDGEYSIQGGIMSFGFTIYQMDEAKADTEYDDFHRKTLPRSELPANPKMTALKKETMPVPYGARIGLETVEDGSILEVEYTSLYVNNTGLPIVMCNRALGEARSAGKMLGMGGSYGTYSFQGHGDVYHDPILMFFENEYGLTLDTGEFAAEELIWQDGAPTEPVMFQVTGGKRTYKLPNPMRKGYEFGYWMVKDYGSWYWGALASSDDREEEDIKGCYSSTMNNDGTTSVTLDVIKATEEYEEYIIEGLKDITFVPFFLPPVLEKDCLTLGFDPQGGTINGEKYYLCETKGEARKFSVDIGTIVPVRKGYIFAGWCTDPEDPDGTLIKNTDPKESEKWRQKGHTELYAVWKTSVKNAKVTVKNQTYTGKALKPAVTVKVGKTTLTAGTDYKVSYKNNKAIGTATVTVKGIGKYTDSVIAAFKVNPQPAVLKKLTAGIRKLTVEWAKEKGSAGYQIEYGLKKDFSDAKTVTIAKTATVKKVLSKLESGKTYYVRIRGYKKVSGQIYVSAWSKKLKAKIK